MSIHDEILCLSSRKMIGFRYNSLKVFLAGDIETVVVRTLDKQFTLNDSHHKGCK